MNRREFGKHVIAGLGTAALARTLSAAVRDQSGSSSRPNVLFLAADDLRGAGVGCMGDPAALTPNIDRLGARGLIFNRAYCQQPICNPSRASLMTGRRPDTIRIWNLGTHFRETMPGVVTLPQWFKQHGYFTQSIGKIYHNGNTAIHGDPESWSVPQLLNWGIHGRDDFARVPAGTAPSAPTLEPTDEIRDVPDEAYLDGRVAHEAVLALRSVARRQQPFFLGVGFWKPHRPFNAPKRYWNMYRREDIPPPRPPRAPTDAPALALESQYTDYAKIVGRVPDAEAELRHGYYAVTSFMDAQLGKVLAELDHLGLADNTIIVFWADHGYQQGEHGMWGKTSCFEYDARVPLIVVPPGGRASGRRSYAIVELLDVYPTLVEMAGLPMPAGLEGESLLPLVRSPSAPGKPAAYTQHPRPWAMRPRVYGNDADAMGYSVRTPNYRYTEWRDWNTGSVIAREFYDERQDPEESINRAADPACADAVNAGAALLRRQIGTAPPREIAHRQS